jgi:membrane protein DedA with SNARE-associated domain
MSIEALVAQYGLIALFVGAGVEGETVTVSGGVLAHQGLLPLGGAIVAAAAGSFAADQLFFAAGRHFRDHPRVKRIQERPAFAKALDTFERHPTAFVLGFRFLYGLRTVSPIAVGTTTLPTHRFVALNALAAAVWGVLFVGIGYLFGNAFQRVFGKVHAATHALLPILAGVIALGAIVGGVKWYRDRRT